MARRLVVALSRHASAGALIFGNVRWAIHGVFGRTWPVANSLSSNGLRRLLVANRCGAASDVQPRSIAVWDLCDPASAARLVSEDSPVAKTTKPAARRNSKRQRNGTPVGVARIILIVSVPSGDGTGWARRFVAESRPGGSPSVRNDSQATQGGDPRGRIPVERRRSGADVSDADGRDSDAQSRRKRSRRRNGSKRRGPASGVRCWQATLCCVARSICWRRFAMATCGSIARSRSRSPIRAKRNR